MAVDRRQEAFWRFEQIAPLLDEQLSAAQKARIIKGLSQNDVQWPSGHYGPIKPATIYNWLASYQANSCIESLMRKKRSSSKGGVIRLEWVEWALVLLEEERRRSLDTLCTMIQEHFKLKTPPCKSSLWRALNKNPKYKKIRAKKVRARFSATRVHQIWQVDAKAEFIVHFADGTRKTFRLLLLLDDASRYLVGAAVVRGETECAAIMLFRRAVNQYGLCFSLYMDLGSCYDAVGFRLGIGVLGVRRLKTKPSNPAAHGKIEKTNQTFGGMFVLEVKHRTFKNEDEVHAFLESIVQRYHQRKQRTLGMSPEEAFKQLPTNAVRHVSVQDLHKAFLKPRTKKLCRKTHHLELKGVYYLVPEDAVPSDLKLHFLLDLEADQPYIEYDSKGILPLELATRHPAPTSTVLDQHALDQAPPLEPLRQSLRGRSIPIASRGFGLPEIYTLLSEAIGRKVPCSDLESESILRWLKTYGPFDAAAFQASLNKSLRKLGPGSCLTDVVDDVTRQIQQNHKKKGKPSS